MLYPGQIIRFIRIGEIRVGTQCSAACFRTRILPLRNDAVCEIVNEAGVGVRIMIRDLRYTAVVPVRIRDPQTVSFILR